MPSLARIFCFFMGKFPTKQNGDLVSVLIWIIDFCLNIFCLSNFLSCFLRVYLIVGK